MKLYLIRHGMTKGNEEKRYVGGRTDEDLSEAGILELKGRRYPQVQQVFASPMKRCIQTAVILYPGQEIRVIGEFRETDFGRFENRNYQELKQDREYQLWLESNGTMDFPEGEGREEVQARVLAGFSRVVNELKQQDIQTAALVVHGGTIMHIMEAYGQEQKNFYDYQVKNGEWAALVI